MCGISALFGGKNIADIIAMTDTIRHRGPDDEGFVLFPQKGGSNPIVLGGNDTPQTHYRSTLPYAPKNPISLNKVNQPLLGALGHRRLSIIDLEVTGHQPMASDDKALWLTYNGEIYNYLELRQELMQLGHTFVSNGDAEVILAAYKQWNEDCLERFNGMFAFVIFDRRVGRLFAARDRFGVKPLYYWQTPTGGIALASEIKQFLALSAFRATLNRQRAYDFLVYGMMDHTSETLFADVRQVRGGEYLCYQVGDATPKTARWYKPSFKGFQGDFEEAADEYRCRLTDAVALRLRADVEVGSCLSGGLDSSSIVCLMSQALRREGLGHRQKTFSACWKNEACDEKRWVDAVVKHCGLDAHYCYPKLDDLTCSLSDLVYHQDEPFGSTSIFAQWEVFRLARTQNVKVMLDGQGADEQLGGYLPIFGNLFFDLFKELKWWTLAKELSGMKARHPSSEPVRMLANYVLPEIVRRSVRAMLGRPSLQPSWIDLEKLGAENSCPIPKTSYKSFHEHSLLQLTTSSVPMLLHWEDRNSMAHSVESRTPFLDWRLVEFTMGLPTAYRVSEGITKKVLRQSMSGTLPDLIRDRYDKIGFATPEEVWLRQDERFRRLVLRALEISPGILIKDHVLRLLDKTLQGAVPFNFLFWRIVSFSLWMERFGVHVNGR